MCAKPANTGLNQNRNEYKRKKINKNVEMNNVKTQTR